MSAAAEMPEDVLQAAREAYHSAFGWTDTAKDVDIYAAIAKAILAERQRHEDTSAVRRGLSISPDEFKRLVEEGKAFADTDPEARFTADSELSCPHCGGSGHKDDVRDQWQPIETAPKDGTPVDLWGVNHLHYAKTGRRATNVTWGRVRDWMGNERDDWQHGHGEDFEPTHWQPLPAAPKGGAE